MIGDRAWSYRKKYEKKDYSINFPDCSRMDTARYNLKPKSHASDF